MNDWLTAREGQVSPAFLDEMRRRSTYAVLHAVASADDPADIHDINERIGLNDIVKGYGTTAQRAARLTRMRTTVSETILWLVDVSMLRKLPREKLHPKSRFTLTFEGFVWYTELSRADCG